MNLENILIKDKHYLVCIREQLSQFKAKFISEIEYIVKNFCGNIVTSLDDFNHITVDPKTIIYVCGNIKDNLNKLNNNHVINIIKDLSYEYNDHLDCKFIKIGEVPININNVGLYFRDFFDNKNYFDLINNQHKFQFLKESNKPNNAFRKGIYLSKVEESQNDQLNFNLLRCSTNLDGPTDNFRETDNEIIDKVNNVVEYFYQQETDLNHVLAQIYNNTKQGGENKTSEKKAKIKQHSDKTKDMPKNGLIVFCTFYENYCNGNFIDKNYGKSKHDHYDYCYKDKSVLTKMKFRLKNDCDNTNLVKNFDVILYPNSVFLITLEMNRLYTHEIIPSKLSVSQIPTRMGYVIRCSSTKAVYKNGQTFILNDNQQIKLETPNNEGIVKLKKLYFDENMTCNIINYDKFYFSLNDGDYQKPYL